MGEHHPPDAPAGQSILTMRSCELFKWANEDGFWQETSFAPQNYVRNGISSQLNACAAMVHQETHQGPVHWTTQTGSTGTQMKSIAESMHNFDRENFQRVAAGLPEMQDEQALKRRAAKTAEIFNEAVPPVARRIPGAGQQICGRPQRDASPVVVGVQGNGITTMEQINAGMRVARKQEKPFMPSPGQFVAWCRSEEAVTVGLPDANELVEMVYQYCRTRGQYPDAESYHGLSTKSNR